MQLYMLSYWGDVEFKSEGKKTTRVTFTKLTEAERTLLKDACGVTFEQDTDGTVLVEKSLAKIHKALAKGKEMTVLKLESGKLQLVSELPADADVAVEGVVTVKPKPKDCPDLTPTDEKEHRALRVLQKFVNAWQYLSYLESGTFEEVGGATGNRYRICSRWSPLVGKFGRIFDVTNQKVLCRYPDFDIPPAEEALSLSLAVRLDELAFLGVGA